MSESNLEDRAAIHDLFTRYCCALDNGVPTDGRNLACVKHRAERRPFEITDVGVPAAAEIACLVRLLADLEDALILLRGLDEIVDLQLTKPAAEGEMLFRGQMLVVKENDLMVEQCPADLAHDLVGEWP